MTTIYNVNKKFGNIPYMSLKRAEQLKDFFKRYDIQKCLELGFCHGKSSAYIAAILKQRGKGHLITVDVKSAMDKNPNIIQMLNELNLSQWVTPYFEPISYTWRLMKMIKNNHPFFDFCYIDRRHTWDNTGFTFFLVDKLLKSGGWILFDDLDFEYKFLLEQEGGHIWSLKMSKTELKTKQVRKVWELLVKKHPNYTNFSEDGWWGFAQKKYIHKFEQNEK